MTTITLPRATVEQALEALEGWDNYGKWVWPESALEQAKRNTTESLAALRAALAQQAEPQDAELSAALGWPGGISDPVLDRKVLLQMVAALRLASQQALECLKGVARGKYDGNAAGVCAALEAALAQQAEPTVKESLQVPAEVAATITTTDIAWLETRRLTKLWQELGQMRWAGADEGWDRAVEAVRSRLNDECQAVLDWKATADQSQAAAVELLQKMQGLKDE